MKPKSILEIEAAAIVRWLRRAGAARAALLLQLLYAVLSAERAPLALTAAATTDRQGTVLRAVMFRIQMMLCCRVRVFCFKYFLEHPLQINIICIEYVFFPLI